MDRDLFRRAPAPDSLVFDLDSERLRKNRGPGGWRGMLKAAGVPHLSMYSLRHFFASGHLTRGRSVQWVAGQLGHSKVTTTWNQYADVADTDRPGDSLVEELLQGVPPEGNPGDVWGTTSLAPGPTGSDRIGFGIAQVPMESENLREHPKGFDQTGEGLPG